MAQAKSRRSRRRAPARQARVDRREQPPTWRGAATRGDPLRRASCCPVSLLFGQPIGGAIVLTIIAAILYIPLGFYTEQFFYNRRKARMQREREAQRGREGPLTAVDVRSFTVGPFAENTYILRRDGSDKAIVVDPGDEAPRLLAAIDELGLDVEAILLTHTHVDHVGAVAPVAEATGRDRLLPGARGADARRHHGLHPDPRDRALRGLRRRRDAGRAASSSRSRASTSTSSSRPVTASAT